MKITFLLLTCFILSQAAFAEIITCSTKTDTNHKVTVTINPNTKKSTIRYYYGETPEEGSVLQGLGLHRSERYRTPSLLRFEDTMGADSYLELSLNDQGLILESELNLPLAGFVKTKVACTVVGKFPAAPQCEAKKNDLLFEAIRSNDLQAMEWNLNCDADVNTKDKNDCTPLLIAFDSSCGIKNPSYEGPAGGVFAKTNKIFDLLLENGAYINVADPILKQTALHKAARFKLDVIENFIAAEADFDAQDIYGYTPLMYAVLTNDAFFVKEILAGNPDRTLKNKKGKTAFDIAKASELTNIINLVKVPDAKIEIIGNDDGTCSPLSFEFKEGETIEVTLKALSKMFLMQSQELNLELMVGGGSQDSRIITFEDEGTFKFTCGLHGGDKQSSGQFIIH